MLRLIICLVVGLGGCASSPAPQPQPSAVPGTPVQSGSQQYHATDLRPGDCVEPLPETFMTTVVPCDVPHSAEFATTYVLREGPYPGDDLRRLAEDGCLPRMRVKDAKRDEVRLYWLGPAEEDWPRHRTVYCLAVPADGDRTTGRVVK